jgi:hypothetical protein
MIFEWHNPEQINFFFHNEQVLSPWSHWIVKLNITFYLDAF